MTAILLGYAAGLFGFYLLGTVPFIPFKPRCYDFYTLWNDGYVDLDGKMKEEFVDEIVIRFDEFGIPYERKNPHELFMTASRKGRGAIDYGDLKDDLFIISLEAVEKIIARRTGLPRSRRIPEKIFGAEEPRRKGHYFGLRECPTMRLIAMMPKNAPDFTPEDDPYWRDLLQRHGAEIERLRAQSD